MRFETHGIAVAIPLQGFELSRPIDDASAHGSPVIVGSLLHGVFAMTVPDPVFRQKIVTIRIWVLMVVKAYMFSVNFIFLFL